MSDIERRDDLLIAVALTEFSVNYEDVDPELLRRAWQLAVSRLIKYDVRPEDAVDELEQELKTGQAIEWSNNGRRPQIRKYPNILLPIARRLSVHDWQRCRAR
ncbi:hypothetical protein [Natronorubrum halophilum]|uniref:hypothetical protein n=1 Tax=Natronorubrum halophilum TaxID=1702106 RepID=UPI00148568C4|nr:hypothetical protein [Natronorubrum halophilum]